jgi:hypothetical protein
LLVGSGLELKEVCSRRQISRQAKVAPNLLYYAWTREKLRGELMTGKRVLVADDLTPVLGGHSQNTWTNQSLAW